MQLAEHYAVNGVVDKEFSIPTQITKIILFSE